METIGIKGCSYIYAPKGQAGEYAPLAANPYRGCGHKCAYCLDGDTLIQMADGTTRPIRDIEVGDAILGVTLGANTRSWGTRIVDTTVLAKIRSEKPAYRITLQDGTIVICSSDHRWLTDRGWKYTASDGQNRPTLTTNNVIRQVGGAVPTPPESESYRLGYIAGMVSGDGNLAIYDYRDRRRLSGKTAGVQHRFRLALKDSEPLSRTRAYLCAQGIETTPPHPYTSKRAPMQQIGTTSPERVAAIMAMMEESIDLEWQRGWLAGIFDAEGSHGRQSLLIANQDQEILEITERALISHGFQSRRAKTSGRDVQYIRLLGGRTETMRFWQLTNPATTRKFALVGRPVCASQRVVSIEPLNETRPMFDIMTGTQNFIANGLISHNCYVPLVLKMDRRLFDAGAVPRPNFLANLRKDAAKYQVAGITEQVMLSFTTDPYNPTDTSLTRPTLEILQQHGLGICTLTKGGMRATADIDLFRPNRDAFACTLTSLDDSFSLKWERGAALPADRLKALRLFHEHGIFTWASLEPTLDVEASLQIIRETHSFVDLFKIGRVNYLSMTKTTDWRDYTLRIVDLCQDLGARHYIKKDLQPYLPADYPNPLRVKQHHGETVETQDLFSTAA